MQSPQIFSTTDRLCWWKPPRLKSNYSWWQTKMPPQIHTTSVVDTWILFCVHFSSFWQQWPPSFAWESGPGGATKGRAGWESSSAGGCAGVNSRRLSLKSCSKLKITPVLPELNSLQLKLQASRKEPVSVGNWPSWEFWAPHSQVVVYRRAAPGWACSTLWLTPNNLLSGPNHSKTFANNEWNRPSMWFLNYFQFKVVGWMSIEHIYVYRLATSHPSNWSNRICLQIQLLADTWDSMTQKGGPQQKSDPQQLCESSAYSSIRRDPETQ